MREQRHIDDGWTVRERQAEDDQERARLRHEATMLGLSRHPGVVQVREATEDGSTLVTVAPTATTLGEIVADPRRRAEVLASLAQTVADLHALGIVHGAIRADTVLVPPKGPPVLDGFEHAGLAGEQHGDRTCLPSDDVAALLDLVGHGSDPRAPGATRGGRRAHAARGSAAPDRPPRTARELARALDAEAACGAPPAAAPTAAPGPPTPPDPFERLRPSESSTTRAGLPSSARRASLLVGLALAGVLALGWGVTHLGGPARAASHAAAIPSGSLRTTSTAPPTSPTTSGRAARPLPVYASRAGVVTVGHQRYAVGGPGDEVLVGAWACGPLRAVLLRPSTGVVYRFDGWAAPGHPLAGRVVATVPVGSTLTAASDRSGCAEPVATRHHGPPVSLVVAVP